MGALLMIRRIVFVFLLVAAVLCTSTTADAAQKKRKKTSYIDKYAALVVHGESGVILHQENADRKRYPASLTKMMTIYLAFDAINHGKLSFNTSLITSNKAAQQPRMKLGLRRNERISVADAIDSLVVLSANDTSVVIAEAIGGSEWQFSRMMNEKARELGMTGTHFENASGLFHPKQITTAKDMAKLLMALERDFPQYYKRLGKTKFSYKGRTYRTHNHVLVRYKGAVAGKTGYVNASGFNLATAANRSGNKLVAVVLGGRSAISRDKRMISLLDSSFKKLRGSKTAVKSVKERAPTPTSRPRKNSSTASSLEIKEPSMLAKAPATVLEVASATTKPAAWNVNMGAFTREEDATSAVANAMDVASEYLSGASVTFANSGKSRSREHWATFHNLSEVNARKACYMMGLVNTPCQISIVQ